MAQRWRAFSLAALVVFASRVEAYREPASHSSVPSQEQECSIFSTSQEQQCDLSVPQSFLPPNVAATIEKNGKHKHRKPDDDLLDEMLYAMGVLQDEYYEIWLGSWPDGIDWTRAVLGTHVSGSIRTLSETLASIKFDDKDRAHDWKLKSNLIDSYFTQIIAYYFGEDDFAIRHEAFDDMLWVVLGWLEAVQFLNTHTDLHYTLSSQGMAADSPADGPVPQMLDTIRSNQTYHGNSWIPAFAHRARIFWDLASQGWDTDLCDGGMVWNPRLLPYKNAITNELFIAASISMYLYFPGDDNKSPFSTGPSANTAAGSRAQNLAYSSSSSSSSSSDNNNNNNNIGTHYGDGTRDPKYLKAAIDGYRWLSRSNMTDARSGLYTDGFHISGLRDSDSNNTRCDQREDTVLTYNQGVLLTGLRGLWEATGAPSYLADGHALVQNVVRATGYDLRKDGPLEEEEDFDGDGYGDGDYNDDDDIASGGGRKGALPRWHGLGRAGVLEDPCDAGAVCNQDATTFKGIYFHHLAAFCAPLVMPLPLPLPLPPVPDFSSDSKEEQVTSSTTTTIQMQEEAFNATKESHDEACAAYHGWLAHNAKAALATRDAAGRFGQWWTAGLLERNWNGAWPTMESDGVPRDGNANYSDHTLWKGPYDLNFVDIDGGEKDRGDSALAWLNGDETGDQLPLVGGDDSGDGDGDGGSEVKRRDVQAGDPNKRGRGRTVETQSGGLALLRAYWKIGRIGATA